MKSFINFVEVTIRIYKNSFYVRMADYYLKKSEKYISDDKKVKRWRRYMNKSIDYNLKFIEQQARIDELKDYFQEKYKGLI